MDFFQIKELITLMESSTLTELEIEREGFKLRINRKKEIASEVPASAVAAPTPQLSEKEEVALDPQPEQTGLLEVTAPMVGTFYRAPAPDAAPYVQVGDTIEVGQVLFIIEAMKMMNEIVAESQGVVKQILAENGKPVEYGQPVMLIDPLD